MNTPSKETVSAFAFTARQTVGQAVLCAGTIGFIVQNLGTVQEKAAYMIAASVTLLVVFFANKK